MAEGNKLTQAPPKVLIVGINYSPEPTGIAPYTAGMAAGLARRGFAVRVLTTFPHYPQWSVAPGYSGMTIDEVSDAGDVTRLRHYVPARPTLGRRVLSEVTFGLRAISRGWGRPDVLVCVSPALFSSAIVFARAGLSARSTAVGLIMQDLYSVGLAETGGGGLKAQVLTRAESWAARRADGVCVIHDRMKARVVRSLGVRPESVSVVRNWTHVAGPTLDKRDDVRERMGWTGKDVVLHAGAMGEKQGLGTVVEAARLAHASGSSVHFVLLGHGGQRASLEARAKGCTNISFIDPLPDQDYRAVLSAADILLVNERPGVRDMAVPSKLTSYFSTGVPVLAATEKDSITAEEVSRSRAGIQVNPGRPEDLLRGVANLCADGERSRAIGGNGPAYCAGVLSEEAAIDRYEAWVRVLRVRAERRSKN